MRAPKIAWPQITGILLAGFFLSLLALAADSAGTCVRTTQEPTRNTRRVRQFYAHGGLAAGPLPLRNGLIAMPLEAAENTGSLVILRQIPQSNEVLFTESVGNRRTTTYSPVELADGRIAALSSDGKLTIRTLSPNVNPQALLAGQSSSRTVKLAPQFLNSPLVFPSGEILAAGFDGSVHIVNSEGVSTTKDVLQTNDAIRTTPVLMPNGSALVSTVRGHLFFVKANGEVERRVQLPAGVAFTPLVLNDGQIVVPGIDKKLYFLNPDGSTKLIIDLTIQMSAAPVLLTNGKIAVPTIHGLVNVYNSFGILDYTYHANSRVRNPVTALPNGGFAVGADNGLVHVVRDGGGMQSQYDAGREIRGPGALLRNGQLVFSSKDGALHFLNPNETEIATFTRPAACSEEGAVSAEKPPATRRDSVRTGT